MERSIHLADGVAASQDVLARCTRRGSAAVPHAGDVVGLSRTHGANVIDAAKTSRRAPRGNLIQLFTELQRRPLDDSRVVAETGVEL